MEERWRLVVVAAAWVPLATPFVDDDAVILLALLWCADLVAAAVEREPLGGRLVLRAVELEDGDSPLCCCCCGR